MQRQARRLTAMMGTLAGVMLLAFLSTVALSQGEEPTTPPTQSFTMVTFEKAVHFSSTDGTDVSIPAGRYDVAPGGEEQLNLMPVDAGATGKAWSILASPIAVPVELPAVAAVALSSDDDQYQIVWLRPNGSGLEAIGSYSGVITRETKNPCDAACQQQKQARIFEMFSKTMANSHEMKKSIIQNLR